MEREKETLKSFIDYLVAHGYPESSIALEYPIGKHRADLAVVDHDTKEPIAIFEFKQRKTQNAVKFGKLQLSTLSASLATANVPTYLVFGQDGPQPFEIERIETEEKGKKAQETTPDELLDYKILKKSRINTAVAEKKKERKNAFDWFWAACWICAVAVITLFILDIRKKLVLNSSQLTLLGVSIALILVPFASKLKILGVEFERLSQAKESEEK